MSKCTLDKYSDEFSTYSCQKFHFTHQLWVAKCILFAKIGLGMHFGPPARAMNYSVYKGPPYLHCNQLGIGKKVCTISDYALIQVYLFTVSTVAAHTHSLASII